MDKKRSWFIDQLTKSQFFHQKLHDWGLLEISYEIESIRGEKYTWDLNELNISKDAWEKIIHKGIKPVRVFIHPEVIKENPKRIIYYRMLTMVSLKSMSNVGLRVEDYEFAKKKELPHELAVTLAKHLNKITSALIEDDEEIDIREFDLWRGMAAGSQAQGSWQNTKGEKAEVLIKDMVKKRLKTKELLKDFKEVKEQRIFILKDGRSVRMGSEPDIGFYDNDSIQIAVEIKGGIDPAGVLERFGAALKSLRRAKEENPNALTILIIQGVSLTSKALEEIEKSKKTIDEFFTLEELLENDEKRNKFFQRLNI
jgi:hypothetical protein